MCFHMCLVASCLRDMSKIDGNSHILTHIYRSYQTLIGTVPHKYASKTEDTVLVYSSRKINTI